ncbi:hypothetical protein AVEN_73545-1 [Araneus ventricosus]|uniref:Uncharacterized protein n=1 Tax=Araneus ventricosus TaxID=182803 RepID=A0A4Y2DV51_ARAVE|nr:hypothetical protein AVEN_73545-1 [Araneus ventricosus]
MKGFNKTTRAFAITDACASSSASPERRQKRFNKRNHPPEAFNPADALYPAHSTSHTDAIEDRFQQRQPNNFHRLLSFLINGDYEHEIPNCSV